ncbi:MAG: hypothetical protein ACRELC_09880 [Gemmatimonadota bacterium]
MSEGVGAHERLIALGLLALVVALAAWLRLTSLGDAPFVGDELDHYYAALSLEQSGEPLLPSGNQYRRGLDITRLVTVTNGLVDDPELAARLPSAVFGILAVVLFAAIGWRLGGPWAAVWAALLLAIYPQVVLQSRQTRFYTYQLCYGLVALYAGWRALDPDARHTATHRALWAGLAVAAFLLGARVQVTTLTVVLGWGAAVAALAIRDLVCEGGAAWRRSLPLWLTAAGIAGALGVLVVAPGRVRDMLALATHVPVWAGDGGEVRAYYWSFSASLPVLLALAPVSYLVVGTRRPWLAVYLLLWIAVPLAIHSFLLPWKSERYMLVATSGWLLVSAIAAGMGTRALVDRIAAFFERARPGLPRRRAVQGAGAAVLVAGAFAVGTSRPFHDSLALPTPHERIHWDRAWQAIREAGPADAPIGASLPLVPLFYWDRLDFVVGVDFLENYGIEPGDARVGPDGSLDWYAGLPVLTRPASIRARYPVARTILIGIERNRWDYGNIAPELKRTLAAEGRELCGDRCGALLLFEWTPHDGAAARP